jgi:hypothetical protein
MSERADVNSTRPLRIVDQKTMQRIFDITDAQGISREELKVPLAGEGDGRIDRLADGTWEIVVPAGGDLEPFFERLAATFDLDLD